MYQIFIEYLRLTGYQNEKREGGGGGTVIKRDGHIRIFFILLFVYRERPISFSFFQVLKKIFVRYHSFSIYLGRFLTKRSFRKNR